MQPHPLTNHHQAKSPIQSSLSDEPTINESGENVQHPGSVIMESPTPDAPVTPVQSNAVSERITPARVWYRFCGSSPFRCDLSEAFFDGTLYNHCRGNLLWPHKCTSRTKRRYQCSGEKQGEKCSAIFKDSRAFNRHYSTVHIRNTKKEKLDCSFEGCHRVGEEGFTRRDNLLQHLRSVHGEDIPHNPVRFNGWGDDGKPRIREG